jgi:hypothetical protein
MFAYWSFRGIFQRLYLVSAFIGTNKNKWLENITKTLFLKLLFGGKNKYIKI